MKNQTTLGLLLAGAWTLTVPNSTQAQSTGGQTSPSGGSMTNPTPTSPISADPSLNPGPSVPMNHGPIDQSLTQSPDVPATDTSNPNPQTTISGTGVNGTSGLNQSQSRGRNGRRHRGSESDVNESRRVTDVLNQSFPQTPGVNGASATGGISNLSVRSHNGKVTLRGSVDTQEQKDAAAQRAAALVGGKQNVDNEIIVK